MRQLKDNFKGKKIKSIKIKRITLNYYVTTSTVDTEKLYGVAIQKKKGIRNLETTYSNNLFKEEKNAEKFALMLAKNIVTPMTLLEIIDDQLVDGSINDSDTVVA